MKILFVCSGNHGISYIVSAQAQSLTNTGIQVEIFQIVGRGVLGYLSSLPKLHKQCRKFNPDIIHAHYSLCGIVARLASRKPVVTSLMGSDVWHSGLMRSVIKIFINHLWSRTIVKSDEMKASLNHARLCVLPNGVDLDLFKPMNKQQCQIQLG